MSESGLRFLRTQARGESFGTDWPDPVIERQAEAPIGNLSRHPYLQSELRKESSVSRWSVPYCRLQSGPRPGVPRTQRGLGSRAPLEHHLDLTLI